jgi:TM2 domain-containing membrane protein YozV
MILNPAYTANMNEQQRMWFYAEYQQASKDEVTGVLLALFLGTFGIHRLYLGETIWCTLYVLFFWTGIPAILGFIECFLMPGRVRAYNAGQAQSIASGILGYGATVTSYAPGVPASLPALSTSVVCAACGGAFEPGAAFCPHCGAAVVQAS